MEKNRLKNVLAAVLLVCAGCSSPSAPGNTNVDGPSVSIGSGSAYLYVVKNSAGQAVGVGAAINRPALTSLTHDTSFVLCTGHSALQVELDYVTTGASPYNKPHLDAYFFLIGDDSTLRPSIVGGPDTATILPQYIPNGYTAKNNIAEAGKGIRYFDVTAPELQGQPFQTAFDCGFYQGQSTYQEVMIDRALLNSKWQGTVNVKQPASYDYGNTAYAGTYSIRYDSGSDTYFIELDNLSEPVLLVD